MDCDVGIDLTAPGSDPGSPVGSVMFVDSTFTRCTTAFLTYTFKSTTSELGTTVLSLNNVGFRSCSQFITFPDGNHLAQDVSNLNFDYWQLGDFVTNGQSNDGFFAIGKSRPPALLQGSVGDVYSPAVPGYLRVA